MTRKPLGRVVSLYVFGMMAYFFLKYFPTTGRLESGRS